MCVCVCVCVCVCLCVCVHVCVCMYTYTYMYLPYTYVCMCICVCVCVCVKERTWYYLQSVTIRLKNMICRKFNSLFHLPPAPQVWETISYIPLTFNLTE